MKIKYPVKEVFEDFYMIFFFSFNHQFYMKMSYRIFNVLMEKTRQKELKITDGSSKLFGAF